MQELQYHPASLLFPMMSDAELKELASDIKDNGLLEPVILHNGAVLDGRNRIAACRLVGIEPKFIECSTSIESPTLYALSRNLHRRHLTDSQRAAIAAETMPLLQEEATRRQETTRALPGEKVGERPRPIGHDVERGTTRQLAARAAGVGEGSVQRAWFVKRTDPEAFEKVKRGELSVTAAANGHKEQPKTGGQQPKSLNTERGRQVANAHKKRIGDGLGLIGGACHGLDEMDVTMAAAVCTDEELEIWANKAETHARELKRFAAKLREAKNGKSEQS